MESIRKITGKAKFTHWINLQFINGMWDTKNFRIIDWILSIVPLRFRLHITSTDHWAWLLIWLDFIDLLFIFEIFGYGIRIDIRKIGHKKIISIRDERKDWTLHGIWNGKEWDYSPMPLFGGLRGLMFSFDVADGWGLFYFDFDIAEWFGGIHILFLHYGWSIEEKS